MLSHVSLNDKTVEGMRHGELPVFSVQYHPEASPGPNDAELSVRPLPRVDGRAPPPLSMIYALLDRLTERYSENEHRLEAMRAREEYFDRAGKVFDDDAELFEGRMASFLEWYVLERPSAGLGGKRPIVHAVETSGASCRPPSGGRWRTSPPATAACSSSPPPPSACWRSRI